MTWGRMDDKFHRNRKVRELRKMKGGREALGAWVFWWSWCLDDGELTGEVPSCELAASDLKSAELLVQVGLWDRTEAGFRYHDFHKYNPTKTQVEKKRSGDRERMAAKRAGGERVAGDVADDSSETSHPRARAGLGRDVGSRYTEREGEIREDLSDPVSRDLGLRYPGEEPANDTQVLPLRRGGVR